MKAPQKKPRRSDPAVIDAIGRKYEEGKELQAAGGLKCDQAKAETYALLGKDKDRDSAKGAHFEIGYFTRASSPSFDAAVFKDLYPKEYDMCLVTQTVFSEEMLMTLVKKKKIKQEHFDAAVVRPAGSKTIDIKRFKQ